MKALLGLKYSCNGVINSHCCMNEISINHRNEKPRPTTAKLIKTESASQPRVIGGIWVIQASIPTGISGASDMQGLEGALS